MPSMGLILRRMSLLDSSSSSSCFSQSSGLQQAQLAIVAQCGLLFACVVLQFTFRAVPCMSMNGLVRFPWWCQRSALASWLSISPDSSCRFCRWWGWGCPLIPVYQVLQRSILGFATSVSGIIIAHAVVVSICAVSSMAIVDKAWWSSCSLAQYLAVVVA